MSYTIPIVARTIRVLNAIASDGGAGSMQQLARSLEIAPSTCFRIVRTLQSEGWIAEKRTGGWELSAGLLKLLEGLRPIQRLTEAARDPMQKLTRRIGFSCKLSVRQGDNAVTIQRAESTEAFTMTGRVGATYPLAIGSSGSVLCGSMSDAEIEHLIERMPDSVWANQSRSDFLSRVKAARTGKPVTDRGSYQPSVHTVSHPVRDAENEIYAALTVVAFSGQVPDKHVVPIHRALAETCREIEHAVYGGRKQR